MKDTRQQEPKPSGLAPHQCNEANQGKEKKFRRDTKKLWRRQEQKDQKEQKDNSGSGGTSAVGANSLGTKKKENSRIICYNCNKKGHISRNCSEPQRNNTAKN